MSIRIKRQKKSIKNVYYTYFSILYIHYKIIQLGGGGKLWSASQSTVAFSVFFTIGLYFTIGEIIGRNNMIKYNLILYGNILLFSLFILNILFFVVKKKYLEIENEFDNNKRKKIIAYIISSIYLLWLIIVFYLASK